MTVLYNTAVARQLVCEPVRIWKTGNNMARQITCRQACVAPLPRQHGNFVTGLYHALFILSLLDLTVPLLDCTESVQWDSDQSILQACTKAAFSGTRLQLVCLEYLESMQRMHFGRIFTF